MCSILPETGVVGDAFIAQRVADCAILVVHAQDPIQVVTERVWRRGRRRASPTSSSSTT